ncbi:SRPBCC domain-containing protein [Asanoa sp. WMMD1127]|uniref:SRPBCC family protein n=1 Tax=Asanoa sp. WMMD1127 TaxID=3016107 RepID=UPI0024168CC0|nr:SRPBCC domain-containing protein [Asanoa sp. WMMD1127]MDG4820806.1 SRPBCC domain-containing protein [Asanoa sp. WMMD1127]
MSHELKVERVIDATVEEVFGAFTDQEAMREWFRGPDDPPDMVVEVTCDPRVGGRWVAAWGDSPEQLYRETNVFRVVDPPHRLAMTTTTTTPDGQRLDTDVDIRLTPRDGKTLVTVVQSGFPEAEVRDYFQTYAWVGTLDRIEHHLRNRKARHDRRNTEA